MFKFSVSSLDVGFAIYNAGNIITSLFSLSFWLWNSSGPNFRKEFELYQKEQEESWTVVDHAKKKSYAQVVQSPRFINPTGIHGRLSGFSDHSSDNLLQARNSSNFQNSTALNGNSSQRVIGSSDDSNRVNLRDNAPINRNINSNNAFTGSRAGTSNFQNARAFKAHHSGPYCPRCLGTDHFRPSRSKKNQMPQV